MCVCGGGGGGRGSSRYEYQQRSSHPHHIIVFVCVVICVTGNSASNGTYELTSAVLTRPAYLHVQHGCGLFAVQ